MIHTISKNEKTKQFFWLCLTKCSRFNEWNCFTIVSFIIKKVCTERGRVAEAEPLLYCKCVCLTSLIINYLHGFLTNPLDCSSFFNCFLTSFLLHPLLRPTFPCISSHALASQNNHHIYTKIVHLLFAFTPYVYN
jgi:hypothetical protein